MELRQAHAAALTGATDSLPEPLDQRVRWLLGRVAAAPEPLLRPSHHFEPAAVARAAFYDIRSAWLALEPWPVAALDHAREAALASEPDVSSWGQAALVHAGAMTSPDWEQLESSARSRGDGPLVAEWALLRAIEQDKPDLSGTSFLHDARRAARVARTEQYVVTELAASLTLARARRVEGHPHLASHILARLRSLVPNAFLPRVDAEHFFVGGQAGPLAELREAVTAGDHARFVASFDDAVAALENAPALREDLRLLRGLIDPSAEVCGAVGEWTRRQSDMVPRGLHAIEPLAPVAGVVIVGPSAPGRRILRLGLPLATHNARMTLAAREHRSLAAAALLAMRREPIPTHEFFLALYGFPYAPRYANTLHVLIHRLRKRLEGVGDVRRDNECVSLEMTDTVAIDDPQTRGSVSEQALRLVASESSLTARDIAGRLGRPLRTVQTALQGLVDGGALESSTQGSTVLYSVEDTTFSDSTLAIRREALQS